MAEGCRAGGDQKGWLLWQVILWMSATLVKNLIQRIDDRDHLLLLVEPAEP
jgi:hypothetical protein